VLAGVSYGAWRLLDDAVGRSLGAQAVSLGVALALGLGAYLAAARLLGSPELDQMTRLVRRRA
jgi:hypothetical protein